MNWTHQREETLRRMWVEGCSAGVIAKSLNITRDAVSGKAGRMGLVKGGEEPSARLPTHPGFTPRPARKLTPIPQEGRVWALDDDDRRMAFVRRAVSGARQALEGAGL
jgi:hypothetical protein